MKKVTKKPQTVNSKVMGNQNDFGSDDESENLEEETIKVEGVKGRFLEVKSINDKYGARPKGIERNNSVTIRNKLFKVHYKTNECFI